VKNMPAPKGNTNGAVTWFPSPEEPKKPVTAKVPQSILSRLEQLLRADESRSAAIVEAIELWIKERESAAN
jgi:metal-responsive CopG/Arc/MetJ family transcriptional regulator